MATTTPGTIVSAVGHTGLVVWLIAGWGFNAEPLPFEVSDVSVVSSEEYARLVAATTPQPGTADPSAPPVPEIDDTTPALESTSETVPTPVQPDVVEPPTDEAPPPVPNEPAEPVQITDAIPELPPIPDTPPPGAPDLEVSPRPQQRQADRIAPEPVAPPPEDVAIAEVDTTSAEQDQDTPAEVVEEQAEETAQQETATETVLEDAVPSGAVETSIRPPARPNRPTPTPQTPVTPAETSTASSDSVEDPVAAALAEAAASAPAAAPDVPQGPPLSGSEREGFRVAVNRCWNVDPGSVAARVTIVVGFSLDQSGKVQGGVVRQVSASGGDASAQNTAFQAARRAILRCQSSDGYQLPADKYSQWKDVEITFDPSGMRLR